MKYPPQFYAEARRMDGLFAGQFEPAEYEYLLDAGILRKAWEGTAGFLGLATLRFTGGAQ